ncbi:MAG: potassium channel protein [Phycisphaerae bacterium]|nr:potassium channel protein [Phycisphaerae bacterium]
MIERPVDIRRQLRRAALVFAIVTLVGALGYYVIERGQNWSLLDSLYMAVITVSTVGFREVQDPGPVGRMFTIVLIVFGVGAFMYLVTSVANYVIAGELHGLWSQRRMEKQIAHLTDHYIICGFGRMGSQVVLDFKRQNHAVVVVDTSEEALHKATEQGCLVVHGDAGDDEVLKQAGVERARGLVSCVAGDAGNLMAVLSARTLNEKLFIVARVIVERNTSKLQAAGANRILWPYGLSGRRMAQMALRPNVVEFLEFVMHDEELELWLEEVTIAIGSELQDAAIGSAAIREKTGAMLVAIRQRTGKMLIAPPPKTVLTAGDIAVALGTRDQLQHLRELAK